MARIEKRGNAYRIIVSHGYDANGKQLRTTKTYRPSAKSSSAVKKEVEKAAVLFEAEVQNRPAVTHTYSFRDCYDRWKKEYGKNLSVRMYQDTTRVIDREFLPPLGRKKMDKITSSDIQKIISTLEMRVSASTVHRDISAVNSVFKLAYKKAWIAENPVSRCTLPKVKHVEEKFLLPEQASTLLKAVSEPYPVTYHRKGSVYTEYKAVSPQLIAYYYLAVYGGFRRGEMLALTWEDIGWETKTVVIRKAVSVVKDKNGQSSYLIKEPKTEAGYRTVVLPDVCFEKLKAWKDIEYGMKQKAGSRWKGSSEFEKNFLFIQDDGSLMYHTTPYLTLKRFLKRYNETHKNQIPVVRLHDLRHTNASILIGAGQDIGTVSRRLGHAKISTTLDIYTHAIPSKNVEASKRLESLLT